MLSRRALGLAVKALTRRDLTIAELDARLERAGCSAEVRATVLERLRDDGYLDDARAARERARSLADRGHGNAAIHCDLERRGVPTELAEQVLVTLEPERERARRLACSLGGGLRAGRVLARKGFEADAIEHALATVANDHGAALGWRSTS